MPADKPAIESSAVPDDIALSSLRSVDSCLCIGLSELIEKPFDVLSQLDGEPVAVFHDNRPAFYIVSPQALRGIRRPSLNQAVIDRHIGATS
jgi:hypothetical protein